MTNIQACLAFNMKYHRKRLGFSQAKLADKIGTAANYIALIEVGKNFPSLTMLEKIAKALEIDALDLFDKNNKVIIGEENLKNTLLLEISTIIENTFKTYTLN